MQNKAALYLEEEKFADKAKLIAEKLKIPILKDRLTGFPFLLCLGDQGLSLKLTTKNKINPIRIDFSSRQMFYRIRAASRKTESIAKAVGLKHKIIPNILDATAGLGQDAFILAALGCRVTLIERSPIIYSLLEDGLNRAKKDTRISSIAERMLLIEGDSIQYMRTLKTKPDIVYLDPMFPKRKKQAAVKKEMAILQALLRDDRNAVLLFNAAIETAKNRVVIKYPRLAPFIAKKQPSLSIQGNSSRFDVYFP